MKTDSRHWGVRPFYVNWNVRQELTTLWNTCKVLWTKWLEPEAKKEWRRLAKQMEAIGILTEVDMAAFAGYCQAYARWKEAEEFITQHGTIVKTPSGYWQQVPQVSIAQTYLKIMNRFAEQFGLTPSSRSRIIASDGEPANAADEMESLLGG